MAKSTVTIPLPSQHLGTTRVVTTHRYGAQGARPKAYVQAGLHADEIPGMLTAHHLIARLDQADSDGAVRGEIIIVPVANPIGLDQYMAGRLHGRSSLEQGQNFNRGFADLIEAVAPAIEDKLGADAAGNVAIIRQALLEALGERRSANDVQELRRTLLGMAIDADMVLDLHCDLESLMHMYVSDDLWPDGSDLAAQLGCRAVMLAGDSGGDPFDEACSMPWWKLRLRFGDRFPIPASCLSATIELRGKADVDDETAASDADNIFRFLQRRGVIAGTAGPIPPARCEATPLSAVDRMVAPVPGIIAFKRAIGDSVQAGEVVAEIVDPTAEDPLTARVPLVSRTTGVLWSRSQMKMAAAGETVAAVAGSIPLSERSWSLLVD
ncbi:succinylglutamate desuccinylase [Skermanella stibiiresistens SB22]|uniref:Succinylglutamate desuccinylase n=1 Tax=Skermanella stibiiresistens SB22 TaxID=1385369 RepID=W9H1Z5_9PROT|nr:succinylglutamate desuccinylase/aspartoacylase family protein [Skermanella stibiiresistens]EWY38841.1 succinylglutamate desuccinylase [Skermanella stibiiresistens SB22]